MGDDDRHIRPLPPPPPIPTTGPPNGSNAFSSNAFSNGGNVNAMATIDRRAADTQPSHSQGEATRDPPHTTASGSSSGFSAAVAAPRPNTNAVYPQLSGPTQQQAVPVYHPPTYLPPVTTNTTMYPPLSSGSTMYPPIRSSSTQQAKSTAPTPYELPERRNEQPPAAQPVTYHMHPQAPHASPVPPAQPVSYQQPVHTVIYQQAPQENVNKVIYRTAASDRWKTWFQILACLQCNCCAFAQAEDMRRRKYIEVQHNRIEWNSPVHCCWCCIWDSVAVVYYDRALMDDGVSKAGCCNPCPYLCPTCFDICGEAVVLKGSVCSKRQACIPGQTICCCQTQVMICGFDNAQEIAAAINTARSAANRNHTDAPATAQMRG